MVESINKHTSFKEDQSGTSSKQNTGIDILDNDTDLGTIEFRPYQSVDVGSLDSGNHFYEEQFSEDQSIHLTYLDKAIRQKILT